MLYKTRGIALSYIKYKDTSIIAKIYTEAFGMQSYIQNGARTSNGKTKMALFQPLTLLDMVVYHKDKQDIHRISEIKCASIYKNLQTDFKKASIALFTTEILLKCLHQDDKNEELFTFLFDSFIAFDEENGGVDNFHLRFLFSLSKYLGFQPHTTGEFADQLEAKDHKFSALLKDEKTMQYLAYLIDPAIREFTPDRETRSRLVDLVLKYYELHVENFGEIKSLRVLREL